METKEKITGISFEIDHVTENGTNVVIIENEVDLEKIRQEVSKIGMEVLDVSEDMVDCISSQPDEQEPYWKVYFK